MNCSHRDQSDSDSAESSCSDDDDNDSLNFRRLKHRANFRLAESDESETEHELDNDGFSDL